MQKQSSLLEHPFLGRGFRPFFLMGAVYSVLMMLVWGGYYAGHVIPPIFALAPISWHAHEMVYGFTVSIIAGFLLTAVANWTGGAPARQLHLLCLCLLWALGRVVMNVDFGLPLWSVQLASLLFIPALAVSLSIPLLKSWNKRNFVFLALLTILFVSQLLFLVYEIHAAIYVALMVVMIMISLIGGRIIPAFTVAALRRSGEEAFQTPQMKMDVTALISLVLTTICLVVAPNTLLLSFTAGISAVIHLLRMRHYHSLKSLSDPMVWILHVGFLWLVIGLVLLGLSGFGIVTLSTALHALTAGSIGSMTFGMMVRVALGHTGRDLIANKPTVFCFYLMQIMAIIRVFGTMIVPDHSTFWIMSSSSLWSLCFAIYILCYAPILVSARPDGRAA
ncbi:MAG: NnrS family protein [Alphaproteobacteria bacterium]